MESPISEDDAALWGTISAFQFMLEHVVAKAIDLSGGDLASARAEREEMLANWENSPSRYGDVRPDAEFVIRQHGLHRLESMWAAIEARVARQS